MTARDHPSNSVEEPEDDESICPINRPLPIMRNCCIKSNPTIQVMGRKLSNPSAVDLSPSEPLPGESSNEILQKMYIAWSEQMEDHYRPQAQIGSGASAENNLQDLQDLYPPSKCGAGGGLTKARAAGVVVETVCHFGKKLLYKHVARSGEVFTSTVRG